MDMTFHDPPSSPFLEHVDYDNQENIAHPVSLSPKKSLVDIGQQEPQSAIKLSQEKKFGLKERTSPIKGSPAKNLMSDFEEAATKSNTSRRASPVKNSPAKQLAMERPESALSSRSHTRQSPSKSSRTPSTEATQRTSYLESDAPETSLRDNEGLTVAMKYMEETRPEKHHTYADLSMQRDGFETEFGTDNTDFNPDGPELTSVDIDDTGFSNFSEMPGLDMTKFAALKQSPKKGELPDVRTNMDMTWKLTNKLYRPHHALVHK